MSVTGPHAACGGGKLDPHRRAGESSVLRWARCPDDEHLLHSADVTPTTSHNQALYGRCLSTKGLTFTGSSSGGLCMTCIARITPADVPLVATGSVQLGTPR
ncbi:MAG: hypothetical protein ACRDS1_04845 [Pseudonocardiaceae bacterium]